jgi:uncharacterized membrane protein
MTPGGGPARTLAHVGVLATLSMLAVCVCSAAVLTARWPGSAALAAVLIVPLLLPLRGLLRRDRRTHAWATLCVAPYFIYGLTEAVANPAVRPVAAAILFASLALFVALVTYLRLSRPLPAAQDAPIP